MKAEGIIRTICHGKAIVYLGAIVLSICSTGTAAGLEPERLFYLSNGEVLQAITYKPAGKGPFPAVVYNQNTPRDWAKEPSAKPFPELAQFYTSHGYVLFLPGRRKWSENEQNETANTSADAVEQQRLAVHYNELQAEVVLASIETLKAQSYVNPRAIYITGHASGGTTALIMAEKDFDVRGYVVFSPAAALWAANPAMQSTLKRAVKNAKSPVFLIQPENDHSLSPAQVLGKELENKGAPNQTKVYPPFGKGLRDATLFSMNGTAIWGDDVLAFFKIASK